MLGPNHTRSEGIGVGTGVLVGAGLGVFVGANVAVFVGVGLGRFVDVEVDGAPNENGALHATSDRITKEYSRNEVILFCFIY